MASHDQTHEALHSLMDNETPEREPRTALWIAASLAALAFIAAVAVRLWRRWQASRRPPPPPPPIHVEGLTEAEAEARRLEGQDNVIQLKPQRTRKQIWQANVYNFLNLNLVGLAGAQLLLRRPLDALLSLGTIALNIGLNVGQEMLARRRLLEIEQATRPQATVIREGKVRSIDPSELVLGDALVIGPGDQVLVDGQVLEGQLVVDESEVTGDGVWRTRVAGDKVNAGSLCVSGRAACQVEAVGDERLIVTRHADAPAAKEELTPLERTIEGILKMLLVLVFVGTAFLLIKYFQLDTILVPSDIFNEVVGLVFNVAPVTLFFMIVVTYATGTADLGRLGALVYRARSVESMAQATVLCFAKAGILTGTQVEIKPVEPPEGQERLAESRLRQILGDYARTSSTDKVVTRVMAGTFEGNRRQAYEQAPFLSVYGWSAVAFDDDDLRGVYVLGDPQVVEAHMTAVARKEDDEKKGGSPLAAVRKMVSPVGRLFRRGDQEESDEEPTEVQQEQPAPENTQEPEAVPEEGVAEPGASPEDGAPSRDKAPSGKGTLAQDGTASGKGEPRENGASAEEDGATPEEAKKPGIFRRLGRRVNGILHREKSEPEEEEAPDAKEAQERIMSFAYCPELVPLHDAQGQPQFPAGLIPLCTLHYTERVRPEAIDMIRTFSETGVSIKVFTPSAPEPTAAMLRQAGLGANGDGPLASLGTITGPELANLDEAGGRAAVAENTIFGQVTPEQAGLVVSTLRQDGESVAVIGDGVSDLPAMRQGNLAIARQGSTQAALSTADIVLLDDSPSALSVVLEKGQRIVHGLLDILKLNLTQVLYLAILLVAIPLFGFGYPYRPGQGTVITVATVALPSVALTLWATAGVAPRARLGWLLARFVAPSAITVSVTATLVYLHFLEGRGGVQYAQLALTHTLVACGLLLVVFIRPPKRTRWNRTEEAGDWRFSVLALILMVVFYLVTLIPLAQDLLHIGPLRQQQDYLIVGAAVLVWAVVLWLVLAFLTLIRRDE